MLPVYEALAFDSVIEIGGRTKPWVVLVNVEGTLRPYVVKVFSESLINEMDSVGNEVLGNILTNSFGLQSPKPALIDFSNRFVGTIRDVDILELLETKDDRLKFGCELLNGYFDLEGNPQRSVLKGAVEIDNVFAFDILIRNSDRNFIKTNMLLRSKEVYLIDHELGFDMHNCSLSEPFDVYRDAKLYQHHIFYNYLRKSPKSIKAGYFHEFEENLRHLNINSLKPFINQLHNAGFSIVKHSFALSYLETLKRNSVSFANQLRAIITS